MSDLRIMLPPVVPGAPGTLESLTINLHKDNAAVQEPILRFVVEKWTSLYTIQVLTYAISKTSVVLLAFVPADALTEQEARKRCEAFDEAQKERRARLGISYSNCRMHNWSAEKLRDLPHFMGVFKHDLGLLHREIPTELQKVCSAPGLLLFRGRYKMRTVSHEAVPPVEGWMSEKELQSACGKLHFKTPAAYAKPGELVMSDYAYGTREFVDAVLDARDRELLRKGRAPKYERLLKLDGEEDKRRIPRSAPLNAAAFIRRVGELAAVPGGWEPPEWIEMVRDTAQDAAHDLGRSISWGIEDLFVHRVTTHSVMLPYSVPAWVIAMLMDGMIRVYYWQSRRKWEKEQAQEREQQAQVPDAV